jgi:hypothetical protein
MGRVLSRGALEKTGTRIWPDKRASGMDNSSTFFLAKHGVLEKKIKSDFPLGIDIKSAVNIWPFNYLVGVPIEFDECVKGLSEEEINAIKALC